MMYVNNLLKYLQQLQKNTCDFYWWQSPRIVNSTIVVTYNHNGKNTQVSGKGLDLGPSHTNMSLPPSKSHTPWILLRDLSLQNPALELVSWSYNKQVIFWEKNVIVYFFLFLKYVGD